MPTKIIDLTDLTRFWDKVADYITGALSGKQDTLISGTSIKTINNTSLLGSGNIDIQGGGGRFYAIYGETSYADFYAAWSGGKTIELVLPPEETGDDYDKAFYPSIEFRADNDSFVLAVSDPVGGRYYNVRLLPGTGGWQIAEFPAVKQATENALGTVKINPSESVTLNASGQLTVGGRMGQFPTTTGMFAPNNRAPRAVGGYSLLMTDALGMDMAANRSLAVVSGYGLTCRSAAAGSTEYRVQNTYANRIIAMSCAGGYASKDESTSTQQQIVRILSVTINGSSYVPDSAANSSSTANDIVIRTAETLNPDGAITSIRLFGKMGSYATLHVGNGVASESGGRNLLLGGGVTKAGSSNDNCLVGNGIYSSGNGNAAFGRWHILRKNRGFVAGTGHDTTNARSEGVSAVGEYSYIDANTLFAVGNGTSHTARSNAFEVTSDSGVVLKSPNGTRYKITVDDAGNLSTSAV